MYINPKTLLPYMDNLVKSVPFEHLPAAMKNLSSQSPQQIADKLSNVIEKFKGYSKGLKGLFGK